jgi:hypothetical protein
MELKNCKKKVPRFAISNKVILGLHLEDWLEVGRLLPTDKMYDGFITKEQKYSLFKLAKITDLFRDYLSTPAVFLTRDS